MINILKQEKVSASERSRVLSYLVFKIKHGTNISRALSSYMEGNRSKNSRPIQKILDNMADGVSFHEAALGVGLIDHYGYLVLDSGIEASRSLLVVQETTVRKNFGVTAILLREILLKYGFAILFAFALASNAVRSPMLRIFDVMNVAAKQTGSAAVPLPAYLAEPWYVMYWVLITGLFITIIGSIMWWVNTYRSDLIYRFMTFRFYEDWSTLLSLYIAFKQAGHSEVKAALSLADSCPDGSFNQILFNDVANSMRTLGSNMSQVLEKYEGVIPNEMIGFFMDADKTRQYDAYIRQAKDFCDHRLEAITEVMRIWAPAITGVILAMIFGLMAVDMFVKLTELTMAPLM